MATHSSTPAWKIPVEKSQTRLSDFTFTFMYWIRKWQPTPVFLPGESQGQRSLVGCRLWDRTESDVTEVTQQQQQLLHCKWILQQLSYQGSPQTSIFDTYFFSFKKNDSVIHIHIYVFFFRFLSIIDYYMILNIFPCVIQYPSCLSTLCITVCICQSQTPNLSLPAPLFSLVTISLFSVSVSLFLFCK